MGRMIPSATKLIFEQVDDSQRVYDALREQDQIRLDALFDSVVQHSAPLQNAGSLTPLEFSLVLMILEVFKGVERLRDDVYAEMRELWKQLPPRDEPLIINSVFKEPDETIPRLGS